jgi:hypothetical protein
VSGDDPKPEPKPDPKNNPPMPRERCPVCTEFLPHNCTGQPPEPRKRRK